MRSIPSNFHRDSEEEEDDDSHNLQRTEPVLELAVSSDMNQVDKDKEEDEEERSEPGVIWCPIRDNQLCCC